MRTEVRYFLVVLLLTPGMILASSDEDAAVATVEKMFRAMTARDEPMLRSTMLPEAKLYSIRTGAQASTTQTLDEFVPRIVASKVELLERFVGRPQVWVRGRMAQVWGEYEFWRDGKFSHCGVDTAVLFKNGEVWKIGTLSYTVETEGCKGPAK